MAFQLLKPFITKVIMLELFLNKRLSQFNSDGFIVDAEETVLQLNAGGHDIERVRYTHRRLNA